MHVILPILIDASLKGLAILLLAALVAAAMRQSSAAARHLVWSAAIVAVLAMPALSYLLPGLPGVPRLGVLPELPAVLAVGGTRNVSEPGDLRRPALEPASSGARAAVPGSEGPAPDERLFHQAGQRPVAADASSSAAEVRPRPVAHKAASAMEPPTTGDADPAEVRWQAWLPWLPWVWLGGAAFALIPLALGWLSLWQLKRTTQRLTAGPWVGLLDRLTAEVGLRRPVVLLQSPCRTMPMTWGAWPGAPAKVLIPEDADEWSHERRRAVLLHELAHIQRRDCLTQILTQVACALNWFNPLAWYAAHRMLIERERACDDLVLTHQTRPSDYARHLLEIASGPQAGLFAAHAGIAMARRSKLDGRLVAILDQHRNRKALSRLAATLLVVVLAVIVLPVACMRAAEGEPANRWAIAEVTYHQGRPMQVPAHELTLDDPEQVATLASFFPGLGEPKQAMVPGAWQASVTITFHAADGTTLDVAVRLDLDRPAEARWAEERQGDYRLPDPAGLVRFLEDRLAGTGSAVTPVEEIAPDDFWPWSEHLLAAIRRGERERVAALLGDHGTMSELMGYHGTHDLSELDVAQVYRGADHAFMISTPVPPRVSSDPDKTDTIRVLRIRRDDGQWQTRLVGVGDAQETATVVERIQRQHGPMEPLPRPVLGGGEQGSDPASAEGDADATPVAAAERFLEALRERDVDYVVEHFQPLTPVEAEAWREGIERLVEGVHGEFDPSQWRIGRHLERDGLALVETPLEEEGSADDMFVILQRQADGRWLVREFDDWGEPGMTHAQRLEQFRERTVEAVEPAVTDEQAVTDRASQQVHQQIERSTGAKATLTTGDQVELVAVGQAGGDHLTWWRPDGRPLDERDWPAVNVTPDPLREMARQRDPALRPYLFLVRAGGRTAAPSVVTFSVGGQPGADAGFSVVDEAGDAVPGWTGLMRGFPPERATTSLDLQVASGAYQSATGSDLSNGDGQGMAGHGPLGRFVVSAVQDHEGDAAVTLAIDRGDNGQGLFQKRLRAKGGRGWVTGRPISGRTHGELLQEVHLFEGLHPDEVSEISVEWRPAQLARFRNISLQPGQATQVEVNLGPAEPAEEADAPADADAAGAGAVREHAEPRAAASDAAGERRVVERRVVAEPAMSGLSFDELTRRMIGQRVRVYSSQSGIRHTGTWIEGYISSLDDGTVMYDGTLDELHEDRLVVGSIPPAKRSVVRREQVRFVEVMGQAEGDHAQGGFGRVHERVLHDLDEAPEHQFLDLDSGDRITLDPQRTRDLLVWLAEQGADLGVEFARNEMGLLSAGLAITAVDNEAWDTLTPAEFPQEITDDEVIARGGVHFDARPELPRTFMFQTREGAQGLLQMVAYVDDPKGLRVRYKLVQAQGGAGAALEEWQALPADAEATAFRWPVAPRDRGARLVWVLYELDEEGSLAGAVADSGSDATEDSVEALELTVEQGDAKLEVTVDTRDDRGVIGSMVTPFALPEADGFRMRAAAADQPVQLSRASYRVLWEGQWIRDGAAVQTVRFAARLEDADAPAEFQGLPPDLLQIDEPAIRRSSAEPGAAPRERPIAPQG